MNKKQEINDAINAIRGMHFNVEKKRSTWRSSSPRRDQMINRICIKCGRMLGQFENKNDLAFCFNCRKRFFPHTFKQNKSWKNKSGKRRFQL